MRHIRAKTHQHTQEHTQTHTDKYAYRYMHRVTNIHSKRCRAVTDAASLVIKTIPLDY